MRTSPAPFFVTGAGTAFAFIPVSIGALAGVAVASAVAATHTRLLPGQGHAAAAALTGGFQWAFWVSGLTALAAVPVTFALIRRTELARAVAASLPRPARHPHPPTDLRAAAPVLAPDRAGR